MSNKAAERLRLMFDSGVMAANRDQYRADLDAALEQASANGWNRYADVERLAVTEGDLADTVCFLEDHERPADRSACNACEDWATDAFIALRARFAESTRLAEGTGPMTYPESRPRTATGRTILPYLRRAYEREQVNIDLDYEGDHALTDILAIEAEARAGAASPGVGPLALDVLQRARAEGTDR